MAGRIRRIILILASLVLCAGSALAGEAAPVQVYRELRRAVPEDARESFLYFTDPHMAEAPGWEPAFERNMREIAAMADELQLGLVLCGGDWIGSLDTNAEAVEKLSQLTDFNLSLFGAGRYHGAVGNHDTNEQGSKDMEVRQRRTETLTIGEYTNAMMPLTGLAYEAFDGENTRFYLVDSGYEGQKMNYRGEGRYRWRMLEWLAEDLRAKDPQHAAILTHIYYRTSRSRSPGELGTYLVRLCDAFNRHSVFKADGHVFDFRACTGRVEFMLCGHIHIDFCSYPASFPVITTQTASSLNEDGSLSLTYDLALVDYRERILTLLRVGSGDSRTIPLDP